MSENRFADCRIVEQVIDRYATQVGRFGTISESLAFRTEATARIRELTPPVSEEARVCKLSNADIIKFITDAVIRELKLKYECRYCGGWGPEHE